MLALTLLALTAAGDIRGSVVDPHQRELPGAAVVVTCGSVVDRTAANAEGRFELTVRGAAPCRISVSHPGFETLTLSIDVLTSAPRIFELKPAGWHEHVDVRAQLATPAQIATTALGNAAMTADQLRVAGPDVARWVTLVQRSAGLPLGTPAFTVNGMPASFLPPAETISSIGLAADPYSVETGGADRLAINITSEPPARWQFDVSPGLFMPPRDDLLVAGATERSQRRGAAAGGPITRDGRIRVMASASGSSTRGHPAHIDHASGGDRLVSSIESAAESRMWTSDLFARRGAWTLQGSLSSARSSFSNAGVGGRSGPAGALDVESSARRGQVVWRRSGRRVNFRGGLTVEREDGEVHSKSSGAGVVFADRLISGAPDTLGISTDASSTTFRALALSPESIRNPWLIGLDAAAYGLEETRRYNPAGQAFVTNIATLVGPRLVRAGPVTERARTNQFAGFGQRVVANSNRLFARIGARAEWQREFGVSVTPRVSVGVPAGPVLIGANVASFSDVWSVSDQLERRFRLRTSTVVESGGAQTPLHFTGRGARRSDTVLRVAVIRPLRNAAVGVEETVRLGRHLSGVTRRLESGALLDTLDDARALTRRHTRVRFDLARRVWVANAFYEHVYAVDDTDGPFALTTSSADIATERGPSPGIPTHAVTGTLSGSLRGVRLLTSARWASGSRYSLLSGLDPFGLYTFNGRAGGSRNQHRLPPSSDLSAYVARQFRLPWKKLHVDGGIRFENMLGAVTVLDVERSAASELAAQPVSAARGRALSVWMTFLRR